MKKRFAHWSSALLGLSLLIFVVRALEKILSAYRGDFDQDPIKHNVYAYTAHNFIDLLQQIRILFQPVLDFALRRYCVFPIFGFDERTFRIPGSICFILAICLVPLAIRAFLKRQGHHPAATLIAAIWSGLWLLENKVLLDHGIEGRHYMAAALVSMAWFSCVFFFESKPRWVFFLLSLLFANTHLFSFPLLAAAFGLEVVRSYRDRNWADIWRLVGAGLAILVFTVGINYPAFASLVERPPGAVKHTLWSALPDAGALWIRFVKLLDLPFVWPLVPLGIAGALIPKKKRVGFLVILGVVFPLFLAYMRSKSNYPFSDRYYLPFFGIGMVAFAYGVDALLRAFNYLARRVSLRRPELLSIGVLLVSLGAAFPGKDLLRTFTDLSQIKVPPRSFTDSYEYYRRIRELPAPKLVIYKHVKQHHAGERHVPNYYLIVDKPSDKPEIEVISATTRRQADNKEQVRAFWSKHAEATVVFDRPKKCAAKPSETMSVVKSKRRCSVIVPGVKNLEDFNVLMRTLGVTLKGG